MSKGTPIIGVRIPPEVRELVEVVIAHRNANSRKKPWTLSDFTALALVEKVRKMARSRGRELEITVPEVVDTFEPKDNWQASLFDGNE